jgi:hypothetical protein
MKKIILMSMFAGAFYAGNAQNNSDKNGSNNGISTHTVVPSQNKSNGKDYQKDNGISKSDTTRYGGSKNRNGGNASDQNGNNSQSNSNNKRKSKSDTLRSGSNPK